MASGTHDDPSVPPVPAFNSHSPAPVQPPDVGKPRPWGPWASIGWMLLAVIALVAAQAAVAVAFVIFQMASGARVNAQDLATNGNVLAFSALASAPAAILIVALAVYLRRCPLGDYLGLVRLSLAQGLAAFAGLALFVVASDLTSWLLSRPIVPPFMTQAYRTASLPLLLLALLVAAPLTEETLFRGFLFRGIAESRWGPRAAIILSSLAWALLHIQYDLFGIGMIIVLGVYLGWVRSRTGSLPLTMLLHATTNTIATIEAAVQAHFAG